MKNRVLILSLLLSLISCTLQAKTAEIDLSKQSWQLWLDRAAQWQKDKLYLPPVNINDVPVNPPTIGWQALHEGSGKTIGIPATVEEYHWGDNGNPYGLSGNYVGVSWFSTKLSIPKKWRGKRIVLNFESVRLRAEVYVNKKLAGYDLINGTPFTVDITDFVNVGKKANLDIRITDPNGNFAWRDWETYKWGDYDIPPSHGFGGVTGKVVLAATDNTYIESVFVKNKPKIDSIDVEVELTSKTAQGKSGTVSLQLVEKGKSKVLVEKQWPVNVFAQTQKVTGTIDFPAAKRWSPTDPNLYQLKIAWLGKDGSADNKTQNLGFRWFEIRGIDGDRQFYLNNKRIVLRTAISWGHWPVNGIYPTPELARKHVEAAKALGLNMLNFHRGIGQTIVFDYADELGLLYYEEPGGYRPGETSEFAKAFKREKLLRMVRRDRNHPSLVIYNMINEAARDPKPNEIEDIKAAHAVDETRAITFSSQLYNKRYKGGKAPKTPSKGKMFMEPYDHEVYFQGWWDDHNAGGPGVYLDQHYNSPTDYLRYSDHKSEIVFWGEEGAIGTPHRLQFLRDDYKKAGRLGWDGDQYLGQYTAFDRYLRDKDFLGAFKDVDALTTDLGKVSHYYQGRVIENIRINNIVDGYVVNGWEGTKIENHSGMVDIFRNIKTDPQILNYYNQPLYVAVKLRNKVVAAGDSVIADFYIVNEEDLKGTYTLEIRAQNANGEIFSNSQAVDVIGGHTYGQLLLSDITIPASQAGYTTVSAKLVSQTGALGATGQERFFVVDNSQLKIKQTVAVRDKDGVMQGLLTEGGIPFKEYTGRSIPTESVMLVGAAIQPGFFNTAFRMNDPLLDWVANGNTMVVIQGADVWADFLHLKEVIDYRGKRVLGRNWFGGNYFVKQHPLFDGLPVNQAFNWEYQVLAQYADRNRYGLRLLGEQAVVGCYADHKQEALTAVAIIPHGRGKIILSALDLVAALKAKSKAKVVAERLLLNYLRY